MDRIAIISDIHGNLEALKATLKDIKSKNIDRIFCLGDIISKGSHPNECTELVKENCEVVVRGNCDEFFTSDIKLLNKSEEDIKDVKWNQSRIDSENLNYLRNLPYSYEFYMSGRLVRLIHAHPEKINKSIGNIDTVERLYELVLPSSNTVSDKKADILIYGHIHTPFIQKMYNRFIMNSGSVGDAFDIIRNDEKDADNRNTTVANYLIISGNFNSKNYDEISYEIVSVPYDIDKELESSHDNIEFEILKNELKTGTYRNMDKVYEGFTIRGIDKDKI